MPRCKTGGVGGLWNFQTVGMMPNDAPMWRWLGDLRSLRMQKKKYSSGPNVLHGTGIGGTTQKSYLCFRRVSQPPLTLQVPFVAHGDAARSGRFTLCDSRAAFGHLEIRAGSVVVHAALGQASNLKGGQSADELSHDP
jgi:hypothetical protein